MAGCRATDVIDALSDLFIPRGVPAYIRSDNDPEFVAQALRDWIATVGAKTDYIEPGSPWEIGYCESFFTLKEAQIMIGAWRRHHNTIRPHSSLGYRPPASGLVGMLVQSVRSGMIVRIYEQIVMIRSD